MTRYDPFAYGEVRLDNAPTGAARNATEQPDDLLFADGGPMKAGPAADDSWSLLEEDVSGLLPGGGHAGAAQSQAAMEFGADILGETEPVGFEPSPPAAPQRRIETRPVEKAGVAGATAGEARSRPAGRKPVARQTVAERTVPPAPTPRPTAPAKLVVPRRGRSPLAATLVPFLLCLAGGVAASWFWVMQQNPVMAGIVGGATLVGALFSWLLFHG